MTRMFTRTWNILYRHSHYDHIKKIDKRLLSTQSVKSTDTETIRRIITSRYACHAFQDKPIDSNIMQDILELTLRAPSGFNLQPYRIILVQENKQRNKLAQCMLGNNSNMVQQAPISAVFVADLEAMRRIDRLISLERDISRKNPKYLSSLPFNASIFAPGSSSVLFRRHTPSAGIIEDVSLTEKDSTQEPIEARRHRNAHRISILSKVASLGCGIIANAVSATAETAKDISFSVMSATTNQSIPTVNTAEGWTFKNTMIAAATYMYSASAHGINTLPMEGFDAGKIHTALNIPDRFAIPCVIATGYSAETEETRIQSPRFKMSDTVAWNQFTTDLEQ